MPLYDQFLRNFVAPNSKVLGLSITIVEGSIGLLIVLGVMTKAAGVLGSFLDLNLLLTFGLCNCSLSSDFPTVFWFYFAPLLLNLQLSFDRSSEVLGAPSTFE